MPSESMFIDVTGGMVLATHPQRVQLPVAVAPADPAKRAFNTIRAPLVVIACWKLPHDFFAFDSSLLDPGARDGFRRFITLRRRLSDEKSGLAPPVTLFGHADPVGEVAYNHLLSGRRVRATYAALVHDVAIWEELYLLPLGGDNWGRRSLQIMLGALRDDGGAPFWDGPHDGVWTQRWSDAIRRFQEAKGADVTGSFDTPASRAVLFDAYMSFLCVDDKGVPYRLSKSDDFVAGNRGKNGKGDFQSCSEFNLQMVLARGEEGRLGIKARNEANKVNRRVIAYLFKPGTSIDPERWPCPAVVTGTKPAAAQPAVAVCKDRFWSDAPRGDARRDPKKRRFFHDSEDTFDCRFYQGFAARSPCEDLVHLWVVRLANRGLDGALTPVANARCVAKLGAESDAVLVRTDSDDDGRVHLPVIDARTSFTLKVDTLRGGAAPQPDPGGDPEADPEESRMLSLTLSGGALVELPEHAHDQLAVDQRLHNLGYGPIGVGAWNDDDRRKAVRDFRRDHRLPDGDSADDDEFRAALRGEYGDADPPFIPPSDG